ncbi:hypothetical protein SAMN05880566_13121 [Janthinobacterium sp. TND4EL3]|nr:hypothetical protein SAMN05880566_13121 [Janthinobacterium sp. TND4EL3]
MTESDRKLILELSDSQLFESVLVSSFEHSLYRRETNTLGA